MVYSNGMTPEAFQTIEDKGVLIKGSMEKPKDEVVKCVNVTARKNVEYVCQQARISNIVGGKYRIQ